MGYRDEGEAALHRVASLEQQVSEERAQVASLQQSLAQANAEIVRLQGNPVPLPEPKNKVMPAANGVLLRALFVVSAVSLVLLGAASYSSERTGMTVAIGAIPVCGATLAAWVLRRRPLRTMLVWALVWGFVGFCALNLFFVTLWRSL